MGWHVQQAHDSYGAQCGYYGVEATYRCPRGKPLLTLSVQHTGSMAEGDKWYHGSHVVLKDQLLGPLLTPGPRLLAGSAMVVLPLLYRAGPCVGNTSHELNCHKRTV